MSRPDLQHACDSLETRLPGLLERTPDVDRFWTMFGHATQRVEGYGVDREDLAYVRTRIDSMLGKHGLQRT